MAKLPSVVTNIAPDLRAFLNRVREAIDGSGTNRLVTVNDLISGGVVVPGPGGTIIPPGGGSVLPPPAPTNVIANGAIQNIIVEWDDPKYYGHAYAEVWGAATDAIGDAVLLGMAPGSIFVDATGPGVTKYYWVRFVNILNDIGPYNAVNGVVGVTGQAVSYLLETLTGAITESQLFTSLGARIDLIDGLASVPGSVNSRIQSEATARANAIQQESTTRAQSILDEAAARASGDSGLQTQIDLITASGSGDFAELLAAVEQEQTARANADAAEAAARQTLAAQMRGSYTGTDPTALTTGIVYNERVARVTAEGAIASSVSALSATVTNNKTTTDAAITSEATTRATADTALSSQITTLTSTVNGNIAAIQSEATTRANADAAISSQITTLSSTVGANSTAIQTEATTRASADTSLFAQYTVKIDTNGYVSGFGLASTANNATPFSQFIIRADQFSISSPSGPSITPIVPFVVTTTQRVINGVTVPVGVYMDAGFIQNGTITNAKIGNAVIDDAKIVNLSAAKITAGAIGVGEYIRSSNFIDGSQGWNIGGNGVAQFAAASIRGTLTATQIDSRGLSIKDSAGNIILNAGTGNFTGSVAGTAAATVVNTANTALSTANSATTTATSAQTTANSASTTATNASTTANNASTAASNAQTTANNASTAASNAQTTANSAVTGLATKLNSNARNVLAGSGGLAAGTINWDTAGNRISGSGVGLTQKGLAAFNAAGVATFALDSSTGNATFAGTLAANTVDTINIVVGAVSAANNAAVSSTLVYPPVTSSNGATVTGPSVTLTTSGGAGAYTLVTITGTLEANIGHSAWNFMTGIFTLRVDGVYKAETTLGFPLVPSSSYTPFQGRTSFSLVYRITGLSGANHTFTTNASFIGGIGLGGSSIGNNWPTGSYIALSQVNIVAMENRV